jgi:hypothetical protein
LACTSYNSSYCHHRIRTHKIESKWNIDVFFPMEYSFFRLLDHNIPCSRGSIYIHTYTSTRFIVRYILTFFLFVFLFEVYNSFCRFLRTIVIKRPKCAVNNLSTRLLKHDSLVQESSKGQRSCEVFHLIQRRVGGKYASEYVVWVSKIRSTCVLEQGKKQTIIMTRAYVLIFFGQED